MSNRVLRLLLGAGVLLAVTAGPAAADPAIPTNYDSQVTAPLPAGVTAEVSGGDAFLVLRVEPGIEVLVPGYDEDEQYLRFLPDGTVEVNRRSQAVWISEDRYGAAPPAGTGADQAPVWEVVAEDGAYAWHDHRIHWMSPALPPQIDAGGGEQVVFEWSVPLVVDGAATSVEGVLAWQPDPLPVVPLGLAVVAAAAGFLASRSGLRTAAAVVGVLGLAAGVLLFLAGQPVAPGVEVDLPPLVGPVVALVGAVVAVVGGSLPHAQRRGLVLLGGIALAATGGLGLAWMLEPQLPVDLPVLLVRLVLAAGAGVGAGVAAGLLLADPEELVGADAA